MSKIISIGTAVPQYSTKQGSILKFMQDSYHNENASRKLKILFNYSGINTRHSVIPDFDSTQPNKKLFINDDLPDVETRLTIFREQAVPLALKAIENSFEKIKPALRDFGITHLITVSCTGLYAPGIDSDIIEQLNLNRDIFHTSFNFLGCNAAYPALKLADMIAKTSENARILIVCVELCTLHFLPKNNNDNLLANTIFGDGAAAVIIVPGNYPDEKPFGSMTINGFYSLLLDKGKSLMSWNITPVNFEMVLDSGVPDLIGEEVAELIEKAKEKLNFISRKIDKWAIHPGGKKILDNIKKQLMLTELDMQYSYKVLNEYGNMSSPTILFVLNEIMYGPNISNETIFSLGFGPGLNIETAILTYAR